MTTIGFNTHFPGYEILGELSRSNARVLKARHLATGDLVAIKHLDPATDAETRRRFAHELSILGRIDHPNIVKIREVSLKGEFPYLVMELVEGGNLRQLLTTQTRLDIPTTTRLGLQLLSAFSAFHPYDIIHRDINPENILYRPLPTGELHFLLTDFGVARPRQQAQTIPGQSLMIYEYAAPEEFNDPRHVGIATDYYSLGVVLYECLSGRVPFPVGNQAGLVPFMERMLHDAPPPLPLAPNGRSLTQFGEVINDLLEKNAIDRISDPEDLAWLLKRAELDYLRTDQLMSANRKNGAALRATGVGSTREFDDVTQPVVLQRPGKDISTVKLKGLSLLVFVLFIGLAIYYFVMASDGIIPISAVKTGRSILIDSSAETLPLVDSTVIKQAADQRRQAQQQQQIQSAVNRLRVGVTHYKVGFLGGLKEIKLQLKNPSPVVFTSVVVEVNYYKDEGGLFKSETVSFTDVGPYALRTQKAPDSDLGTRLQCTVRHYTLPDNLLLSGMTIDSAWALSPSNR